MIWPRLFKYVFETELLTIFVSWQNDCIKFNLACYLRITGVYENKKMRALLMFVVCASSYFPSGKLHVTYLLSGTDPKAPTGCIS